MLIAFRDIVFHEHTEKKLVEINRIIFKYKAQGYQLTLRQLYYQLVIAGVIKNERREYQNLIYLVNRGRLAGRIDWMAITDRGRLINGQDHYTSPKQALESLAHSYSIDKWKTQDNYVEVWFEKDALSDIVGEIARDLDINYLSGKGYFSTSALFEASLRFKAQIKAGRKPHILYIGDHSPSGLDMANACKSRLEMFGAGVEFKRIGLTKEQIELYDIPPSPVRMGDMRSSKYVKLHGKKSWEIDALGPDVIQNIIRTNVLNLRDEEKYQKRVAKELLSKQLLMGVLNK